MTQPFGPNLDQRRNVVTDIPGPRSQELAQRRKAAVSAALGAAVPVYADRAGGGVVVFVPAWGGGGGGHSLRAAAVWRMLRSYW